MNDVFVPKKPEAQTVPTDTVSVPVQEVTDSVLDVGPIDSAAQDRYGPSAPVPGPRPRMPWVRTAGISLIALGVIAITVMGLHSASENNQQSSLDANLSSLSQRVKPQTIPLTGLNNLFSSSALQEAHTLTVNGQIDVNGSLELEPTTLPTTAVAGEMFFNKKSDMLAYFNGTSFITVQGGSNTGSQVVNNATTNITNVTNNTTSGGGGVTAVNGLQGAIAMFTGSETLGSSLISETGNSIDTGSGVEDVTLGSTNAASATMVQGGTGNLALVTGSGTGDSGDITIQSGNSSASLAGNVSIDTGTYVIAGIVVDAKDFEDGLDNMGDGIYGDNSTVTQSNVQAESGTHSLSIAVGSNAFPSWAVGDGTSNPPYNVLVTAGHTYAFQAWVRAGTNSDTITASVIWSNDGYGGGGEISEQTIGTVTDVSTGWRKVAGVLTAPAGAFAEGMLFTASDAQSVGEVHYFDNITVTDLSSSSSSSSVSIGATNAQLVTIGNSAQFSPTSIYGGGINLTAGLGILALTGSTITATSGGASYATTSGALDITAASSSTWKVAGSDGTGGDLVIQSGNAGGTGNDGGNLIFQGGAATGAGIGGGVIVKSQTDSTTAFQIQNSSSAAVFTADTSGMIVTVSGSDTSFATLIINDSHIESTQTTPPTIGMTTCAGTPVLTSGSTDSVGSFSTGTLTGGGQCVVTITFNKAYGISPKGVMLTPMNAASADTSVSGPQPFVSATSPTTFTVTFNTAVGTGSNYMYYYWVVE